MDKLIETIIKNPDLYTLEFDCDRCKKRNCDFFKEFGDYRPRNDNSDIKDPICKNCVSMIKLDEARKLFFQGIEIFIRESEHRHGYRFDFAEIKKSDLP